MLPPGTLHRHRPNVREAMRRMTYPSPRRDGPRTLSSHGRCDQPSGRREWREPEDRPASEPLRRRPVAKDQLAEGASALRVALIQNRRGCPKPTIRDRDDDLVVSRKRDGPTRRGCSRRDEDAGVGAVDEPDGDGAGEARIGPQLEAGISTG